jgi:proteic killer suppression protein
VPILSFSDAATEEFFIYGKTRKRMGWATVAKVVKRKLDMIHYATRLDDLRSPPANRLELLHGDLEGWHSIRVNDQWRILFVWTQEGAEHVRVDDYH